MADTIITPKFRVSFPNVFRPGKAMQVGAEPKYGVTMLFPKGTDLSALHAAAKMAIEDKWGADKTKWPKNLRNPFRDQGEKEFPGYEAGAIFVTATSKQRPGLVDATAGPDGKLVDIIEEHKFYPGCFARASVRAFVYDQAGNRGVSFGLQNIQKLADGEPLGGRTNPSQDFEPVASSEGATTAEALFG